MDSEANSFGISIRGAREHNLKNIDVFIPHHKMTVLTGLSGSGKSSLAFDTIHAEAHRRYVESLSAYARSFLESLKKPEVDSIQGLSPTLAIDQKTRSSNPRSTVGTITEIYDSLRLLFARMGVPQCPTHKIPVTSQTPNEIMDELLGDFSGRVLRILSPMAEGKKGEFLSEFVKWRKQGFLRARVDGVWVLLENAVKLAKSKAHDVDLLVDQLAVEKTRFVASLQTALALGQGRVLIESPEGDIRKVYSIHRACPKCGFSYKSVLEPRMFSFNNPRGACPTCHGLGTLLGQSSSDSADIDDDIDDDMDDQDIDDKNWDDKDTDDKDWDELAGGSSSSANDQHCPICLGTRLNDSALSVTIGGKNIAQVSHLSAQETLRWLQEIPMSNREKKMAESLLGSLRDSLEFMIQLGADYLSIDRASRTLSGGEAQRIRLVSQLGSALIGVLYVMDEPSIGLHPRDHHRLLRVLDTLKARGNTLLLVEHDEETIRKADWVLDLGPGAGREGGQILAVGTPKDLEHNPKSLTGQYLSGQKKIPIPTQRRTGHGPLLQLKGARGNNLKNVHLNIPLGTFTVVTGVSGSGKSSLIIDTLYPILSNALNRSRLLALPFDEILGLEHLDRVIEINQSPIGRTPRSIPATYVEVLPLIRAWFSQLPESRMRGYGPGRFSFNVAEGRCAGCQGQGQIRMKMHFMADVYVECDSCRGLRYNRETLSVRYREKNIADVLALTVEEARDFFKTHGAVFRKLETLHRVGLGYLTLGQSSTSLSGGEAQRVKLSRELSKRSTGSTLYILDEPTTGLHFQDVQNLLNLLQELTGLGNTVLVIEHQLDVIRAADWIIDMGSEGGDRGGQLTFAGTPEDAVKDTRNSIAAFL